MIQALVFDLDDTLYRERDFVKSGYRAIARWVSKSYGCDCRRLYDTMIDTLDTQGREWVMTAVVEQFPEEWLSIEELVSVYRNHRPAISLYPGYSDHLKRLSRQYRLGIITDGLPEVQERKVKALGLESLMDAIVYTWQYGKEREKPHPYSFGLMLESIHIDAANALYIGDNPVKDCMGAHRAGMQYAQINHTGATGKSSADLPDEEPEFYIDSLFQLPDILQETN
jgi:putative hydrolase of the HAD superfamily